MPTNRRSGVIADTRSSRPSFAFLGGPAFDLGDGLASDFSQLLPGPTEQTHFLNRWVEVGDPPQAGHGANLSELPKLPYHHLVGVHTDWVL